MWLEVPPNSASVCIARPSFRLALGPDKSHPHPLTFPTHQPSPFPSCHWHHEGCVVAAPVTVQDKTLDAGNLHITQSSNAWSWRFRFCGVRGMSSISSSRAAGTVLCSGSCHLSGHSSCTAAMGCVAWACASCLEARGSRRFRLFMI